MKEVSHGGTSFIIGRERSSPVKVGFAGAAPAFQRPPPAKTRKYMHKKKASRHRLAFFYGGEGRLELVSVIKVIPPSSG